EKSQLEPEALSLIIQKVPEAKSKVEAQAQIVREKTAIIQEESRQKKEEDEKKRIEVVIGQLAEEYHIDKVKAEKLLKILLEGNMGKLRSWRLTHRLDKDSLDGLADLFRSYEYSLSADGQIGLDRGWWHGFTREMAGIIGTLPSIDAETNIRIISVLRVRRKWWISNKLKEINFFKIFVILFCLTRCFKRLQVGPFIFSYFVLKF
ncbi:MAG: hypothetical protein MUD10_04660, partial [Candidatus Pacebacteria bacterium]|nr:hypothetical protein [Candidatus Paceibacterota bacterium]